MAANNASNVSAGKPRVGGAIFTAPLGTTLPTDAVTALSSAFENIGYISEDGVTNNNTPTTEQIKAWGGDVVYNPVTEKADEWTFTAIEVTNPIPLKLVYGDDNVTGDLASGITVRANNQEQAERVLVIDMVLRGSILKRVIIPRAQVIEVGEISYVDDDLVGYETTISAHPDASIDGDTHREYIIEPKTAQTTGNRSESISK